MKSVKTILGSSTITYKAFHEGAISLHVSAIALWRFFLEAFSRWPFVNRSIRAERIYGYDVGAVTVQC